MTHGPVQDNPLVLHALDDILFDEVHRPMDGRVPESVGLWEPRLQLRWFERFRRMLFDQRMQTHPLALEPLRDDTYWCDSFAHKGYCCGECEGWGAHDIAEGPCCCRHPDAGQRAAA